MSLSNNPWAIDTEGFEHNTINSVYIRPRECTQRHRIRLRRPCNSSQSREVTCVCSSRARSRGLQLDGECCPRRAFDREGNGIVLIRCSFLASECRVEVAAGSRRESDLLIHSVCYEVCGCTIITCVLAERIEVIGIIGIIINQQIGCACGLGCARPQQSNNSTGKEFHDGIGTKVMRARGRRQRANASHKRCR